MVLHGESASADLASAKKFLEDIAEVIAEYDPRQVFNVDETGLLWKKVPRTTYIPGDEEAYHGYKEDKQRVTLLLGGNAAGEKLTPFFINKYNKPRAMRGADFNKLGVYWSHNTKAWMTKALFKEWFATKFVPDVSRYLAEQDLPNKALLLIDNAPGHDDFSEFENIKILYLPKNTTSILQPMDQAPIRAFKAHYIRLFMQQAVREENQELSQFVRNYNMMHCVDNCVEAWKAVTEDTMKNCWHKLYKERATPSVAEEVRLEEEIVDIAREAGLADLTVDDVVGELIEDNMEEPAEDDTDVDMVSEDEDDNEDETEIEPKPHISELKKALQLIEEALSLFSLADPVQ